MSARHNDYLWDPRATPDAEVERLERLLRPFGANARRLAERELPIGRPERESRWRRRVLPFVAIAASLVVFVYVAYVHRLSWRDGSPWPAAIVRANGAAQTQDFHVGERIATAAGETAILQAARIGAVTIGPDSVAMLTRSRKGQHRIELERGRLHAKVWAPPSYFGVTHGDLRFTDLGCEFELTVEAGSGTLAVTSGWVVYRHRDEEMLVPENYVLTFDAAGAAVPLRVGAPPAFRERVTELDTKAGKDSSLANAIAAAARDDDFFTLLTLLVRYPQLAESPLYERLAAALHVQPTAAHRERWVRGDAAAREEWWQRLPAQPKTWWLNWRDAF